DVYDLSSLTVDVVYRVDGGTWETITLDHVVNDTYSGYIPAQGLDAVVEYYYVANDTSGKITELHDIADYFTYTVSDTVSSTTTTSTPTTPTTTGGGDLAGLILLVIGVVVVIVMFIVGVTIGKKKGR
ncbi:MAG: hypothetical protein RTU30_14450, partial [Candidatus Thorarchaeota archaeon]